jgi:AcrR family transcriptional regulator
MLEAATEVFLEKGFEAASLGDVIARSGGSRATLYAQFGNKEGLFAAIIASFCERIVVPLAMVRGGGVSETLAAFAQSYMELLMEPRSLGLYRIVTAEGARFPALASQVFRSGPEAAAASLAAYFRAETRAGRLSIQDPEAAARQFLEMVKGDWHTRALFGLKPAPNRQAIRRGVRSAVSLFLEGASPR